MGPTESAPLAPPSSPSGICARLLRKEDALQLRGRLAPPGVELNETPITPRRVLAARAAKAGA